MNITLVVSLVLMTMLGSLLSISTIQQAALAQTDNISPNTESDWSTFESSTYGITIQYPSGWDKKQYGEIDERFSSFPFHFIAEFCPTIKDVILGCIEAPERVLLGTEDLSSDISLEKFTEERISSDEESFNNLEITESIQTTLGGYPAQKVILNHEGSRTGEGSCNCMRVEYYIIKDNKAYILSYLSDSIDNSYLIPAFEKMAQTFQIN